MNRPARFIALAFLALDIHAHGEGGPWQVQVEMQIVRVSTAAALELIPALREERRAAAAADALQTRIAKGEATLIAWPMVLTRHGERAVSETLHEPRYATDFDPHTEPGNHGVFKKMGLQDYIEAQRCRLFPDLDGLPVAYETRNLGVTLEVTPLVSRDGAWIDAAITPTHVVLLGLKRVRTGKAALGGLRIAEVPRYFTAKTETRKVLRSGQWSLIGSFVVPVAEPRIELFIVRATARSLAP